MRESNKQLKKSYTHTHPHTFIHQPQYRRRGSIKGLKEIQVLEKHIKLSFPENLETTLGHLDVIFVGPD